MAKPKRQRDEFWLLTEKEQRQPPLFFINYPATPIRDFLEEAGVPPEYSSELILLPFSNRWG